MGHQPGQQAFFLPAEGIEPDVISADIGIYVGRTAHVQLDQVRISTGRDYVQDH